MKNDMHAKRKMSTAGSQLEALRIEVYKNVV
jgi:hypothetical protein